MKKKLALLLAAVCLLSALCGCGGSKKELEPAAFVQEMLGANFTDSLSPMDEAVVPILYNVSGEDYSSAIVYCGTAATAEEIAVFTAVDEAAAERLLSAARDRVASQLEAYKNYGPASAMMLENAIVKKTGNHVVVVVCADADSAAKIADNYL